MFFLFVGGGGGGGGGDLYLTHYGAPYCRHLMPENWYASPWMQEKRQRLQGTGTVYRLPTKPVEGHLRPSIDLCIKWSRVGQDVPLDTFTLNKYINAEFNSPFEEFALVEELRRGEYGPRDLRIRTQKPLGIYVPSERMQLWQTGRSLDKVMTRVARRPGVEIDILRAYILIYGWIAGPDAVTAYTQCEPADQRAASLAEVTAMVDAEMQKKGFVVIDHKPVHVITRVRNGQVRKRRDGKVAFAVVDYELLERTADHENTVQRAARSDYLVRQKNRFRPTRRKFPAHLHPANVMGVDYVYGRTESTGGALWVVGKDPNLFAYFLPERWRMKQVVLSDTGQAYYVHTKDQIHLVWKVSRVGEIPPSVAGQEAAAVKRREHGYNAPFEKVALALEMASKGVRTVYPRAIYMTGPGVGTKPAAEAVDDRRYAAFAPMRAPDGRAILPRDHDYVAIYGYWRGRDDEEAVDDQLLWTPIDLAQATSKGIITAEKCVELVNHHHIKLLNAGFIDLDLKADHILLSYIPGGAIKMDSDGVEELRHCNFELVTRRNPNDE
ncbi:MAG: hypothetical protein FWD61_19735 [Phycisphaerales bacterium]|nr:hypothetical protein [Phycisphaerales bacterium]